MSTNTTPFEMLLERTGMSNLDIFNPEQSQQSTIENDGFDVTVGGTPPVSPIPRQLPPSIPQWGKTLAQRVDSLDQRVDSLERKMNSGFTKLKDEMNSGFTKLKDEIVSEVKQLLSSK